MVQNSKMICSSQSKLFLEDQGSCSYTLSAISHFSENVQVFNWTLGSSRTNSEDPFLKYNMNLVIWFISFNLPELLLSVKWKKLQAL